MEIWQIVVLVVAVLVALLLAVVLIISAAQGAVSLFAFAGAQGFLWLAAYIACWVLFFPLMLTICIIVGFVMLLVNWVDRREERRL